MLVPAWDFGLDAWLGSRNTSTRSIENGFNLLRSSREGFLSANDSYGRVLKETISAPIPGARLLVPNFPVHSHGPTLYTKIGDVFAWLCVAAALAMMIHSRRRVSN
jgi:apolipoprotein N-acyltransferase